MFRLLAALVRPKLANLRSISDGIHHYAELYGQSPILVAAIVVQESGGNVWASRVENKFFAMYLSAKPRHKLSGYVPEGIPTYETELRDRSYSFGLMQVMGETARSNGFKGQYLHELHDINANLDVGCRYLARCFERANRLQKDGKLLNGRSLQEQALIYYNGSPAYPPLVLAHITSGRYRRVLESDTKLTAAPEDT